MRVRLDLGVHQKIVALALSDVKGGGITVRRFGENLKAACSCDTRKGIRSGFSLQGKVVMIRN